MLATPMSVHNSAGLGPAADAFTVDLGGIGEDGQPTQKRGLQVFGSEQILETAAKKRDRVICRVPDISLGVDGQPGFSLRLQHVPKVQVPVDKCLRLVVAEVSEGRDSGLHDALRQGMGQPFSVFSKVFLPALDLIPQTWQTCWGLDGEPPNERPGDSHGLIDVIEVG